MAVGAPDVALVHLALEAFYAGLAVDQDGDGILASRLRLPVVELQNTDVVVATVNARVRSEIVGNQLAIPLANAFSRFVDALGEPFVLATGGGAVAQTAERLQAIWG
jgi:nucleotidyltransferase/DNA polymerase involved in DNA repair